MPASTTAARDLAWGCAAIVAALGLAIWMRGFAIDDALISIRYARHLAAGQGYRFNVGGPSTDGVTPLPWPFVLAPFARASALVVLGRAKALGLGAWLAAAGVWGASVGRAEAPVWAKGAAFATLALCLPVGAHAVSGMETALAMALATAASVTVSPLHASAVAGLVASLRPEMAPWAVTFAVAAGRLPRAGARLAAAFAPFLVCAAVRAAIFGRPAPLAVLAKPSDLEHGVVYAAAAVLVGLAPVLALAPVAFVRAGGRAAALALAAVAHTGAIVAVGGDWMPFGRLIAPILPSVLYAFVLAAPAMSRALVLLRGAVVAALAAYVLVRAAPAGRHVGDHVAALVDAARPELVGASRVAALDVGWPTAATEATIIDLAGLTDPEIASLPGGHTSKHVDAAFLLARDPDVLLLSWRRHAGERVYWREVEASLAESDLISRHYEARATLPSFGEDDAGYAVLRKRAP